jgi:putative PIN family toxin of toxin-antitoxin system
MSGETGEKVVFDCVVFAQALINPKGPAAACLAFAQQGRVVVFVSDYVLQEIRELPRKINPRFGVTSERVDGLIQELAKFAQVVGQVAAVYVHPIDPDDSHYVNLALAAGAKLIASRDRHLLDLMDSAKPHSREFQARFPSLRITTPESLIASLRTAVGEGRTKENLPPK